MSSKIRVQIASSICLYLQKMTPEKRQNDEMFIFGYRAYSCLGATSPSNRTSNSRSRVPMRKSAGFILLFVPCAFVLALAGSSSAANAPQESELYAGWLKMYDLQVRRGTLASSLPGNRAIRTIHLVQHPTPRPTYFPSWPDWALSNLNYLSTIPASKTARSCGPIRPGRHCSFRRSPRRTGWRTQHCKDPASIPMRYSSSL